MITDIEPKAMKTKNGRKENPVIEGANQRAAGGERRPWAHREGPDGRSALLTRRFFRGP
jgi:hypothetical protein